MINKLILMFFFILWSSSVLYAEPVPNATCPVMEGESVKEKHFVDYQGKRFYFCCSHCIKKFNKNPSQYLKD